MRTTKEVKDMCKDMYASWHTHKYRDLVSQVYELAMTSNPNGKELNEHVLSPEGRKW